MTSKYQNHIIAAQAATLDLKSNEGGRITGYGATFGNIDRQGDVLLRGAFTKSLERITDTGDMPAMLWSHAQEQPIGRWLSIVEDDKGLRVEGKLNLKTERGREAHQHVLAGDAGGLSIGYTTPKGGREYAGKGTFHLKEVDVYEISVVAIPANPLAKITGAKSAGGWQALSKEIDPEQATKLLRQLDRTIEQLRS